MARCKHDTSTLDCILDASRPYWKFQECVSCGKEMGKWKIPIKVWEELWSKRLFIKEGQD